MGGWEPDADDRVGWSIVSASRMYAAKRVRELIQQHPELTAVDLAAILAEESEEADARYRSSGR